MAYTWRSMRWSYENISTASGSTSSTGENHILGTSGHGETSRENLDNITGTSTDGVNTSFIANRVHELDLGCQNVSDANLTGFGGVDITPTSATTPGYTSATSWTSGQGGGEQLGSSNIPGNVS